MLAGGPCELCDRDPAAGYASVTKDGYEAWYCHDEPDEHGSSCYERAQGLHVMSESAFLRWLESWPL